MENRRCDGSPLKCRIFIVGTNSARLVEKPFLSFLDLFHGFKKKEFLRELYQLSGGPTPTRRNIEHVADAAGQNGVLDTNIYLSATPRANLLDSEDKKSDVFEFLLRTIKPEIVLAHGNPAKNFFRRRCGNFVEDTVTPRPVTLDGQEFRLLCSQHLSFKMSAEAAKEIGRALAKALQNGVQST